MATTAHFVAFAAVAMLMVVVPGPSVLFAISRALTVGRRDALLTVVGNAFGVYVRIVAVAFGIGALVTASVNAFSIVKLCGASYLVYLGVQAIRHRHEHTEALTAGDGHARKSTLQVLRDGFVVGLANPKSIVFFAALLPQFVDASEGSVSAQVMLLGLCVPVFGLVFDSSWALAASVARDWFARSPQRLAAVGGTGGLVLIGLGTTLALTGHDD